MKAVFSSEKFTESLGKPEHEVTVAEIAELCAKFNVSAVQVTRHGKIHVAGCKEPQIEDVRCLCRDECMCAIEDPVITNYYA